MDFGELTANEFSKFQDALAKWGTSCPDFQEGEVILIRTVTFYWVGRVKKVTSRFLHLEDATFIADAGEYDKTFKTGEFQRAMYLPGVHRVAIAAIADVSPWPHKLKTA
jgi:hypothetical protein